MGQFSWLDCKTGVQILDDEYADVYLLVPKEFGGGHIKETCYDGYGHFGGYDVYDLVADWNREYLSQNPDYVIPRRQIKVSKYRWYQAYANLDKTKEEIVATMNYTYSRYREIGIDIACYDEDNAALPYPIKITYDKYAVYEDCAPSDGDPNQGWLQVT